MQSLEWIQYPQLVTASRWLLALVFLISAIGKFQDMPSFISITLDYQVLPILWARRFAIALPWLEISIALLLIFGLGTQVAAGMSIMLLLSFVIAVGLNLLRGRKNLDCGCQGGRRQQKISSRLLLRNACLLLFSLQIALWGPGLLALDNRFVWMAWDVFLSEVALPLVISLFGVVFLYRLLFQIMRLAQLQGRQ
jgi:uncharacterized membrane protein YphA (DoxX/SURF4 family)